MTGPAAPNGVEKTFTADELIVSKTDLRGRLTYVNRTFVEISGYEESALIGQPHNVIRHPDMPRSIFHLMWERIAAGHEIFAYVVNLCADGRHYWVLAHVTPTRGVGGEIIGYHSNRRTASAQSVRTISDLYRELCAVEQHQPNARLAVQAGTERLEGALAATGLEYDEFIWTLCTESRAA